MPVNVVRGLERRLEKLLEGVAGRVFSGRLHPAEIAGKLAREADFARFETDAGPATANAFTLLVNPKDLAIEPATLEAELAEEVSSYTAEEGLRLEGPVLVSIQPSQEVAPGGVICHVEVAPGPPTAWAKLVGEETTDVGRNRVLVGRAPACDVVIDRSDVSRIHAHLWREKGTSWLRDAGSSNGTFLDGAPVDASPREIQFGSVVAFASHQFRFTGA